MKSKSWFKGVFGKALTGMAALFMLSVGTAAYAAGPDMNVQAQQTKKVTGTVVDATGEPVIGATVMQKGTNNATVTDIDGNYTINVPAGATLVITYIGMTPLEIPANGGVATLQDDSKALDEVVVTALGIKKDAKKLGYAVSTVSADELTKTGGGNLAAGLYGKATGVAINSAPGGGTSAVSFTIRGLSSITGNTQPLIVMDGVPVHNGNANNDGYWDNQRINSNGMVDINPEDIESISILKGAAASALYGSEAANGVVMITTIRNITSFRQPLLNQSLKKRLT